MSAFPAKADPRNGSFRSIPAIGGEPRIPPALITDGIPGGRLETKETPPARGYCCRRGLHKIPPERNNRRDPFGIT